MHFSGLVSICHSFHCWQSHWTLQQDSDHCAIIHTLFSACHSTEKTNVNSFTLDRTSGKTFFMSFSKKQPLTAHCSKNTCSKAVCSKIGKPAPCATFHYSNLLQWSQNLLLTMYYHPSAVVSSQNLRPEREECHRGMLCFISAYWACSRAILHWSKVKPEERCWWEPCTECSLFFNFQISGLLKSLYSTFLSAVIAEWLHLCGYQILLGLHLIPKKKKTCLLQSLFYLCLKYEVNLILISIAWCHEILVMCTHFRAMVIHFFLLSAFAWALLSTLSHQKCARQKNGFARKRMRFECDVQTAVCVKMKGYFLSCLFWVMKTMYYISLHFPPQESMKTASQKRKMERLLDI